MEYSSKIGTLICSDIRKAVMIEEVKARLYMNNCMIMDSKVGNTTGRPHKPDSFQIPDSLVFKLVQMNQSMKQITENMNFPDIMEITDMEKAKIMRIFFNRLVK